MPLRPFPSPLRVGIDIIKQDRIRSLISSKSASAADKHHLYHFLNKLLTHREQGLFRIRFPKLAPPRDPRMDQVVMYLAGRWAAKEAIIKAVAPRKLGRMEIEILRLADNPKPFGAILDKTSSPHPPLEALVSKPEQDYKSGLQELFDYSQLQGQAVELSISHDGEYATAVCIAPEMPRLGDVGGEAAAREP